MSEEPVTGNDAPELVSEHGRGQSGPGAHSWTAPPTPAEHRAHLRQLVAGFAESLVGVHEVPPHSNDGPAVHRIQSSTGAYRAPWCVSTVQYEDVHVLGTTYAHATANAYAYAEYAREHGDVIRRPVVGCAVVYHIGAGHAGRVVAVNGRGTFWAVEGNEGDAVRRVWRDPTAIACEFVLRPELRL